MKNRQITLSGDSEDINWDDLTTREKQIYGSGYESGWNHGGLLIICIIFFMLIAYGVLYYFINK